MASYHNVYKNFKRDKEPKYKFTALGSFLNVIGSLIADTGNGIIKHAKKHHRVKIDHHDDEF